MAFEKLRAAEQKQNYISALRDVCADNTRQWLQNERRAQLNVQKVIRHTREREMLLWNSSADRVHVNKSKQSANALIHTLSSLCEDSVLLYFREQ